MSDALLPCESCHRHLRAGSARCPFCASPVSASGSALAKAILMGAALAAVSALPAESFAQSPRERLAQAPAAAYGAPPDFDPLGPGFQRPNTPAREVIETVHVREVELRGPVNRPAAQRALTAAYPRLRRCVELGRGEVRGEVRTTVVVSPLGRVLNAHVNGAPPRVQACVGAELRRMNFGRSGGLIRVSVTVQVSDDDRRPAPPTTCAGPNPSGCRQSGCGEGMICDTRAACRPSSCGCTPQGWVCTSDCGGGVCRPARGRITPGL